MKKFLKNIGMDKTKFYKFESRITRNLYPTLH